MNAEPRPTDDDNVRVMIIETADAKDTNKHSLRLIHIPSEEE